MRNVFLLDELEAVKASPQGWLEADYALLGRCEYWIRQRKSRLGIGLRAQLHGLIRRSVLAYRRAGRLDECPWTETYDWKAAPAIASFTDSVADDVQPTLRVTQVDGSVRDFSPSATVLAQVLDLLGDPAPESDAKAAVLAEVAKELEGVKFEGGVELLPEVPDEVQLAALSDSPKPKNKGGRPRKVAAAGEGGSLP